MSAWFALLAAGLLEIGWALGLKYSDGLTRFWPTAATVLAIILSFALMAVALKSLPFGTAYAVWTGIGAAGSIIVGMILFSESADPIRILCLMRCGRDGRTQVEFAGVNSACAARLASDCRDRIDSSINEFPRHLM